MKKAGVMGWPVAHSLSPALHQFWLREHGIDGSYESLAVPPDRLAAGLRALASKGFAGCNLTIPHKEAALPLMELLDPARFWRAHRGFVVNIDQIREVMPWFKSSYQLRMNDKQQTEIPVSRAQTKRLRELFNL